MSSKLNIYAECDNGGKIYLEKIDPATGDVAPLTDADGVVSAVLSLAEDAFAPAKDGLDIDLTYIGAGPGQVAGDWSYFFDGADLGRAAMDALDTSGLTLIIRKPDDTWEVVPCKYVRVKKATLVLS